MSLFLTGSISHAADLPISKRRVVAMTAAVFTMEVASAVGRRKPQARGGRGPRGRGAIYNDSVHDEWYEPYAPKV
uniref:Uncharacterized protein n=1 Tax=Oryza sativa subsp. japonica TaxID=39947 RepID=Q6YY20_ORYSJ|nr:hypothetical protein [Oryza sativa Japonica Group]